MDSDCPFRASKKTLKALVNESLVGEMQLLPKMFNKFNEIINVNG